MLRPTQAWDHIWDNLVALEDPTIVKINDAEDDDDDNARTTLIGTATLKDWVMGGYLTSRLYVQDRGDSILFLRPLHKDDLATSDRQYELKLPSSSSDCDDSSNELEVATRTRTRTRMAKVRDELKRLCYLATLQHPLDHEDNHARIISKPTSHQARSKLGHNQGKRKFFGI